MSGVDVDQLTDLIARSDGNTAHRGVYRRAAEAIAPYVREVVSTAEATVLNQVEDRLVTFGHSLVSQDEDVIGEELLTLAGEYGARRDRLELDVATARAQRAAS